MSKVKTSLKEPTLDNRLLDDRGPTCERLARNGSDFAVSDTGVLTLRIRQSPIERAVARGIISEQHGRAAEKFYRNWRRSGLPPINSNWKAEPSPSGRADYGYESESDLAAVGRRTISRALAVIHEKMDHCGMSRDAIKLLFSVVCDEIPFEASGKAVWPQMGENAAGTLALRYVRSALRVLTIEWGL